MATYTFQPKFETVAAARAKAGYAYIRPTASRCSSEPAGGGTHG